MTTTNKGLILIVEDEAAICDFIGTALLSKGYKILKCSLGKEALSLMSSHCPDIVLLDLGLPDMNGTEVIKEARDWCNIPIIVISARSDEKDKVEALDLGADDYLTKPFGTSELLARIRTALRHRMYSAHKNNHSIYQSNGLQIDFEKHLIQVNNKEIHLTQIEFKIITLLAKNSGKVLTYDSIQSHIWGPYGTGDNQILRVNMANIRRKIEKNPAMPEYLFTEVGVGYRMAEEDS